jgi:O-antigen/teichoic acid export membrane protein
MVKGYLPPSDQQSPSIRPALHRLASKSTIMRLWGGGLVVDTLIMSVAGALALVTMMVVGLYLARLFGPTGYGRVTVLLNEYLLFSLVSGFGLTIGATNAAAQADAGTGAAEWSPLCTLRLLTLTLPLAIGAVWSAGTQDPLHLAAAVCASAAMVQDFLVGALQGLGRFRAAALFMAGQPILFLMLVWALVRGDDGDLAWVILGLAGSFVVACIGAMHQLARRDLGVRLCWPLARAEAARLLRTNGQFQVITFLYFAFGGIPLVTLGNAGFYTEAGLLAVVRTLVFLVPSLAGPTLGGFYYATARRLLARGDGEGLDRLFGLFTKGVTVVGSAACCLFIAFPTLTLRLLYSDAYLGAAPLLVMMAGMSSVLALESLTSWTLVAHGRARRVIVALALRLGLVLLAVGAFLLIGPSPLALLALGGTYLLASAAGLVLELRWLPPSTRSAGDLYYLVGALLVSVASGALGHLLDTQGTSIGLVPAAVLVTLTAGCVAAILFANWPRWGRAHMALEHWQ